MRLVSRGSSGLTGTLPRSLDSAALELAITGRTKAIIAVHLYGQAADMEAITLFARRHGLIVIEDCAQAHLTEYKGRLVGTIGDMGCFSFQQSKHITTGDGGRWAGFRAG